MQGFFDFVKSLGAARMAAMAAVTLALIGFFSFLMIRMTTPQMVPLFTDLSVEDSASIVKDLERQAIDLFVSEHYAMNADQLAIRGLARSTVALTQPTAFAVATGII